MNRVLVSLLSLLTVSACSSSRNIDSSSETSDYIEPVIEDGKNGDKLILTDKHLQNISLIDGYLENTVPQIPDSIICAIDSVLAKAENDTAMMNFLTGYIFDKYFHLVDDSSDSGITGIENIVIHIIDNYYLTGRAGGRDEEFMENIIEYAGKNRATLTGMQAKELKMETLDGGVKSLYDIDAPYTLICFFDASCSYCQYEIPEIYKIYQKFKNKGLAGFCVYTRDDKKEWLEFVSGYKLTDWINVWDPKNENDYRIAYSLYIVPKVYVLDRNKKIAGRELDSASLSRLLNDLIKK
ncbi:MAG: TlpA family protein disulfide reductase [Prevotellaceae bacterium]|jgi:peroxiredoxin|nr:TlpA family protein disulfide reductase [Prevotellaceae bacterium]